jgi:DNA-binding MarR family transcriptional regulator
MDLDRVANELLDLVSLVIRGLSGNRDLSLTAVATLGSLDRAGAQRITTLAAAHGVSQPSMTQLAQRLEQRGLVSRSSDPADGRVALVKLTDLGRQALAERRRRNAERIAELLRDLPEGDVAALRDALESVLPTMRTRLGTEVRADPDAGK